MLGGDEGSGTPGVVGEYRDEEGPGTGGEREGVDGEEGSEVSH